MNLVQLEQAPLVSNSWKVICVGAVAPAAWTYTRLQRLLEQEAHFISKDLEGYTQPLAADYGLRNEVDAITCVADTADFQRFHLVGFSAGGSVALAFAVAYPERVNSLTLIEPAWIGNDAWDELEVAYLATVDKAMQLPVSQRGHALLMAMSPPGIDPSTIPSPDWLLERSEHFEPIWRSFREATLDITALQSFPAPVYLPVGDKSHPRFTLAARWLSSIFPHCQVDIYHGQTHLDAPPIRETERFAYALRTLRESLYDSPHRISEAIGDERRYS